MRDRMRVGTRGSRLALAQAELVIGELKALGGGLEFTIVPIKTAGDLAAPGGRGSVDGKTAFTGEIESQLVEGGIDAAVHSMKDLPTTLDERLMVAATPRRGDPRDALVSAVGEGLSGLKKGARVGTSSARRRAQLLAIRRDLEIVGLNGNVETRLRKLEEGRLDAVVLAAAGLERVGLGSKITQRFETDVMVPAVCQGTLAVEVRRDRPELVSLLARVDDPATRASSECERAFSEDLGGDCYVPLGAFADAKDGGVIATGMLADPEGEQVVKSTESGSRGDAALVGSRLASRILDNGGESILRRLKG